MPTSYFLQTTYICKCLSVVRKYTGRKWARILWLDAGSWTLRVCLTFYSVLCIYNSGLLYSLAWADLYRGIKDLISYWAPMYVCCSKTQRFSRLLMQFYSFDTRLILSLIFCEVGVKKEERLRIRKFIQRKLRNFFLSFL